MDVEVHENPDQSRFEVFADGELAGFAVYRRSPGQLAFVHTEIADAFEGHGLGSRLATAALDAAREEGAAVLPFCPFIRGFIARHPEYAELVPKDERGRSDP
jgi:predicted GNAT family acetyltransferase